MALNKLKFNSINVTPAASEAIRFNSSANGLETASAGGNLVKIASTTASSSSSISFTSGIDSTYKEYIFLFNNIHPSAYASLQFQTSTNGGSSYGVTVTSTVIQTTHDESGSSSSLAYETGLDLAQSTNFQNLGNGEANDNDAASSGILRLFEPSSTTFVKHFIGTYSTFDTAPTLIVERVAGYFNTTSAINAIQFKMSSGNIDSGTITMYGVK
tara:strand:+ start:446 stop:1087 length:642 start_codon:yes stop_codon:yes gene_type:complete